MNRQASPTSPEWNLDIDKRYIEELNFIQKRYPSYYQKIIEYLTLNPDHVVRGRAFPLKGARYHGAREYKEEIPEGTFRLFYELVTTDHKVQIYYVGRKPGKAPFPPSTNPSTGKKGKAERR